VALADLNRDGKLDVAVENGNSDSLTVLLGSGGASFVPGERQPVSVRAFLDGYCSRGSECG